MIDCQERKSAGSHAPTPLKVLVVDDNQASALTLSWAIESWGDEVRTCFDGLSALDTARSFHPDVILLDLGMPEMDGLTVARTLRADPRTRRCKIIAQTGWGDTAKRRETAEAGFDLHLVKPIDFTVLQEMFELFRMMPSR
ncbi:response regulator [Asticcacaulis sp. AND118]|uniref:response regulator n=1 Tax=Asticcacaulis sp. AND118 TaxID=2840468 RepID=UPI001CFFCA4E|nr:response regulator [Asticcacaulis sp. AND118]UDF05449.1 response regulator [Asticcacaulis sp. AND118]